MKIILADLTDASIIHNIMMQAYEEYRKETPPSSALDETISSIEKSLKENEQAFLYYHDYSAVGTVRFQVHKEQLYFSRLAVIPSYRGQKIASSLIQALEKYARKQQIPYISCKVRMEVKRNIKLYQSLGFHILETEMLPKPNGISIPVATMLKKLQN